MFQICSKGIWKGRALMAIWQKKKNKKSDVRVYFATTKA
jgi:hypothetical protein